MTLPFNAAADRNKEAIGDALSGYFDGNIKVFEIGSGTGQHAIYLCERFPGVIWQTSDQSLHLVEVSSCISQPKAMQALREKQYSFVYSANTAHIMSMEDVTSMFTLLGKVLAKAGFFALYGPFKVDGEHTSEGNLNFDQSLRTEKPHMGIRDKEELVTLGVKHGLQLLEDISMPANNRILLWRQMS